MNILQWKCTKCNEVIERSWNYLSVQYGKPHFNCKNIKVVSKILPKVEEFCKQNHYKLVGDFNGADNISQWKCTDCGVIIERSWHTISSYGKPHYKCKKHNEETDDMFT